VCVMSKIREDFAMEVKDVLACIDVLNQLLDCGCLRVNEVVAFTT